MLSEDMDFDGQLIEEFLRYLRGRGPLPRIEDLSADEWAKYKDLFDLLEAVVDSDIVDTPPLKTDPVAIRLGLTSGEDKSARDREPSSPDDLSQLPAVVASPLSNVVHQLNDEIELAPWRGATEQPGAPSGLRVLAECRSLGELIIVCTMPNGDFLDLHRSVARMFVAYPSHTAVAVASSVTGQAVVLTHADCVRAIDPAAGWVEPALPQPPEPLELALRRYLERSLPRWDEIARMDEFLLFAGADDDVADSVSEALRRNLGRVARIHAKKVALGQLKGLSADRVESILHDVRSGRLASEGLIARLRELSEAAIS